MKTILLVVTKAEMGGAQEFVLTLARGLKKQGWNVLVGSGEEGYVQEELMKDAIPFYIFKNLGRTHNPFKNFGFIIELYRFCKKQQVDIVHLNSSNALVGAIGAKLAHKKTITTLHGLSFLDPNHATSPLLRFGYKLIFSLLLKFIDQTIFVNKHNFDYAQNIGLTTKGKVIYNGVDIERSQGYSRDEARKIFSEKIGVNLDNAFIIGSIGRYAYPKNYEFVIEHFKEIQKQIPNLKLVLIGEGPDRTKYEDLIQKLQLQHEVFLPGEMRPGPAYLKGFDLFILPSVYEGLPLVILEAQSALIPAIASKVGGIPEILDKKFCFTPNSIQEFLQALQNVLLEKNVKKITADFTAVTMVENYIKLYESVA